MRLPRRWAPTALLLVLLAAPAPATGQDTAPAPAQETTPEPAPVPPPGPAPEPPKPTPSVKPELSKLWAFVDRRVREADSAWSPSLGAYVAKGSGMVSSRMNANMLVMHATAALAGEDGPARRDARIAKLVERLTRYPAFVKTAKRLGDDQGHAPGWFANAGVFPSDQHISLDPQVADGLMAAWSVRDVVGLTPAQVAAIQREIGAVSFSRYFRYDRGVELNQFNWAADLYADDFIVNRRSTLLRGDYRAQLVRFLDHARRPLRRGWASNLNAGLGFHYNNERAASFAMNRVSTSEYANIVFHGVTHVGTARQLAGMRPLGGTRETLLRKWAQRLLMGDWTHAGYLNWDTGHNWGRWHLTRYWVFALAGLGTLGEAAVLGEEQRRWARWMFSEALRLYERYQTDERRPDMPSTLFGVWSSEAHPDSDPQFIAARVGALVAEAAYNRTDERKAAQPPALYAWDPDIHRLAVTTPRYSAAIVDEDFVLPYGGADLARLYDASGRPLGAIGSRRSIGFDLRVTSARGTPLLDTQRGTRTAATLRLRGVEGLRGTFERVGLDGLVGGGGGARVRVSHRFTPTAIERTYDVEGPRGGLARVRLPVWSRFEEPAVPESEPVEGGLRVRVRQPAGGYVASVTAPGPLATAWLRLGHREKVTPGTAGVLEVLVPLPAGRARVAVTLMPDPV